jgi:TusA-related sulfurtransferase|tara:strand:- start:742 stop:999 length:258 start_codon:yes stop_codon:yes gene_type:complete
MKIDLSKQSNIKTLDLKGQICPWPVIFTMKELQKMNDGDILKVTIDHLPSTLNIPAAASKEGNEVVSSTEIDDGVFQIEIKHNII